MRIQTPRLLHPHPFKAFLLSVSIITALTGSAAAAQTDGLPVQPSITSAMAAQSVMLSVARAGQRLVAVGERGFIIVSDDNGGTWKQVSSPISMTLVKVRFIDDREGWAVGHAGVVLHSQDGGLSWSKQLDGVQAAEIELQEAKRFDNAEKIAQAQQLVDDGPDKPLLDLLFLVLDLFVHYEVFASSSSMTSYSPSSTTSSSEVGAPLPVGEACACAVACA